MQAGLPNRPIDLVVKAVGQVNFLRLPHLDQVGSAVVETRVMTGYDGIMSRSLAQVISRGHAAWNNRVRVNQAMAACLNVRSKLRFEQVPSVRLGGWQNLRSSLRGLVAMRNQADASEAQGNQSQERGRTKN
jgi:hypothetical protein